MIRLLFLLIPSLALLSAKAQQTEHVHDHSRELGIANAPVYYVKEGTFSYGLHLHYLHQIGSSRWALGLGYEQIFDEHEHRTVGVVVAHRPYHGFTLALSPGVTREHDEPDLLPTVHAEAAYEWDVWKVHMGPNAEIAWDPEDIHLSLGLHIGIDL